MGVDTMEMICYISYRFLLPAVLATSALLRVSIVSLIWLLFFLALPCLPKFSYRNWIGHGSLRVYLILLLIVSTMACCGHVVYYSLELSHKINLTSTTICNTTNLLLMNVGYQSLSPIVIPLVLDRLRLIMPDFIVFLAVVITTVLCFNSTQAGSAKKKGDKLGTTKIWRAIEPLVTTICLFLAGAAAPSLLSGVYFTTFMIISTLWAFGVKFGKLPHIKLLLLTMCGLQVVTLYVYQFRVVHAHFKPDTLTARLLGYVQYYNQTCSVGPDGTITENPLHLRLAEHLIIGNYVFIFALFALYFSLALSARYMIKISGTTPICQRSEEQRLLLENGRPNQGLYNTITVDAALEDASQIRGSIRSRHSSLASSAPGEEQESTQILNFISRLFIDQVYLLTLAVLMLWSITYISWMEFVLLVLVCFLCICPKAKEASYSVAYPLVGYGTILVVIQYLYALDLSPSELKDRTDIGLKRDAHGERGKPVLFKALYLSVFWLHLRAYLHQQNSVAPAGTLRHNRHTINIYKLYRNVRHLILTYWPVVCYITLTGAALHSNGINIMRIVYLLFFAIFMFCYIVSRKPLELRMLWLWYLLITYAMLCVILMYTYQFSQIRDLWTDDAQTIADIGLSKSSSASNLFTQLLVPILVLLAVTIQLRVFRAPLNNETEENEYDQEPGQSEPPAPEEMTRKRSRLKSQTYMANLANNLTDTMKEFWQDSKSVAARVFHISLAIMEMHSPKLVSLAVFYVCVWRVNVINVVLLLVTVSTLPWPLVQYKLTIPLFCWVCWEIFSQLVYQLHMMSRLLTNALGQFMTVPCNTTEILPYTCGFKDESDFQWLGYHDMGTELGNSPWRLVWGYVVVVVFLVVQRLLVHYMKGRRSRHVYILRAGGFPDFIFPNITRESAETNAAFQLMYLCNNFFVLFGKEVVYIAHVIVAAIRFDVYGFLYIVLLGVWKSLSERHKSKGCMSYIVLINVLISIQYLLLLGLPPGLCVSYPWCGLQAEKLSILIWLYLPTIPTTSNPYFIFADFLMLLCMTRQWHVFTLQKLDPTLAGALEDAPGPDYADPKNKSFQNTIKLFIFTYFWWLVAAVLFINAVTTISIFSAGFLLATFSLLWYGSSQLTRNKELLLARWEIILIYAYIVILVKILLQIPSCMTFHTIGTKKESLDNILCILADLFKLVCLQTKPEGHEDSPFEQCSNPSTTTGLTLDAVTFAFVLIQIRIFNSPYFKHAQHYLTILMETSAQGAMIMKHRMTVRTKMTREAEEKYLLHIKQHVIKLKADHDSKQAFDFGTKELVEEANEYWRERERREADHAEHKTHMYLTQDDLTSEVVLSDEDTVTSRLQLQSHSPEGGGGPSTGGGGGPPSVEDGDGPPTDSGGAPSHDAEGNNRAPRGIPTWSPKPHKPEKSSEEVVMEFLEFSHESLIAFIEFTISWLDDKSGDYRYTSAAIFKERYAVSNPSPSSPATSSDADVLEEVPPSSPPNDHLFLRFLTAFYYFCLARTELLCFLFMILNHFMNASLVSMFYPIIAFLWGMVSFPRPSGIFWYSVIIYCKVTIIIKYIFQFNTIQWNMPKASEQNDPMWPPNLLGLTKTNDLILKTVWDLLILMGVFFHKSCLETAGIWSMWYNTFDDLEDIELQRVLNTPVGVKSTDVDDTIETSLTGSDEDIEESGIEDVAIVRDSVDFTVLAKLNFVIFWKLLVDKTKKDMPKDLYMPMLLSSLLALLVTVLGWSAFGKIEGQNMFDVSEIISTNYIPSVFLIILLIQFMMMIIDRILYLKRHMLSKYIYQVLVVLVVHGYLFIFQPWFTKENFKSMAAWIAWYLFFCCYFTLSAFQIQAGYLSLKTDSIILRTYGYVTYVIYLGYLAVPFLWELEVLLNWVCTETTLTLDYWIKYSDIKVYLFKLKCWQVTYESAYYLGEKQPAYMKYGIGGLLVLLLIFIIWFPLLFMSVITTNSIPNPPTGFKCSLSISGLQPLVKMDVASMPEPMTDRELDKLKDIIAKASNASNVNNNTEYMNRFKSPDVTRLDLFADSTTMWEVSPAAIKGLEGYLSTKDSQEPTLSLLFSWSITRKPDSSSADVTVSGSKEIYVLDDTSTSTKPFVSKSALKDVITNCQTTKPIRLDLLVPTFFLAKEKGASTALILFPKNDYGTDELSLKNVTLKLEGGNGASTCDLWDGYYWSFNQITNFTQTFHSNFHWSHNKVQFYLMSERIVSSQYQLIASYGIIGLYISVVLVIFKFIRLVLADSSTRIVYQEMPCPDLLMSLVSSTEMVRSQSEFVLEQVLFRKLILLYRSPETLIVWTGRHRHLKEE